MSQWPESWFERGLVVALVALSIGALTWDALLVRTMTDQLHMNDFGKFYDSARAFLEGRDMYVPSPASVLLFDKAPGLQLLNMNPPHFHLIVLPFALLPPTQAVALWMAAGVFTLAMSLLIVMEEVERAWTPIRALTVVSGTLVFAGTQAFFATGQLSMLLLLAMTLCWRDARRSRWDRAACWLGGCLSIKPFLLIFLPYLLVRRRWRAFAIVLATAAGCCVVGLLVFGGGAYAAWYQALSQAADWAWLPMNASVWGCLQRTFSTTPYFASVASIPHLWSVWIVIAVLVGLVSLASTIADARPASVDRAFGLLLVAAQLISPLGWVYYLWLPLGPVAALALRPAQRGRPVASTRLVLVGIAAIGLAWPLTALYLFQPQPWATLTVGSAYFWATAAAWVWVLLDKDSTAQISSIAR